MSGSPYRKVLDEMEDGTRKGVLTFEGKAVSEMGVEELTGIVTWLVKDNLKLRAEADERVRGGEK